jgi:hypothetical protein
MSAKHLFSFLLLLFAAIVSMGYTRPLPHKQIVTFREFLSPLRLALCFAVCIGFLYRQVLAFAQQSRLAALVCKTLSFSEGKVFPLEWYNR